jgi:hypothetical protein
MDGVTGEAAARQPHDIEAAELGAVSDRRAKRDHIVLNSRHPADECALANANKLVHRREATKNGVIANPTVPAKCRVIDENDVASNLAVVGDMRSDEEQAFIANPRQHPAAFGPGIDRDVLADGAILANLQSACLAAVLLILGWQSDAGERKDFAPRSDGRPPTYDNVRVNFHTVRQAHTGLNDRVGTD